MATTRLIPLHVGKGRTEGTAIRDILDYSKNPDKTEKGELITSYACDHRTADAEFLLTKREYLERTGRYRGKDDVIAYHMRQSFLPGEITPEEANRMGQELARRFTHGNHAYIIATHTDKQHMLFQICPKRGTYISLVVEQQLFLNIPPIFLRAIWVAGLLIKDLSRHSSCVILR